MSTHIGAKQGEVAERILLPGDPLRAKYIADNFLENAVCYSKVRGMYGFTGTYKGVPVSVQGTGMGLPSISIYVTELIREYGVKKLIRIGTCGTNKPELVVGDVIMAITASTDSNINYRIFKGDYAAAADFELLYTAYNTAKARGVEAKVRKALSGDTFYRYDPDEWKKWAEYDVAVGEMEGNALYTIAAKYRVQALAMFTISDSKFNREANMTSEQREKSLNDMITLALDTIIQ